jgi:sterol desaturase/sphingolipid hydroxylase (fatty acid hydroxylase superfamily)
MELSSQTIQFYAPGILLIAFLGLLGLEQVRPLRRRKRALTPRFRTNMIMTGLTFVVGNAIVKPAALGVAVWAGVNSFGLLHWLGLPALMTGILGFLLMDLTFYYWHRFNHLRPLLWRFHNVHHIDPDMDVSTSFRFHLGEIFYSTGFRILQAGLIGVTFQTYIIYEFVFTLATMFHHSNWQLPIQLERRLNKVFVTPRMHGIHHSAIGIETNSNYSVIFMWWDGLNDTLRLNVPQKDIIIGVPGYLLPECNRLGRLLTMPFTRQRPYWRWPSGKALARVYHGEDKRTMLE